ncbi:MAG: hypothetical protein ABIQ86_16580 [Steroidobacteraceae bacterium]
MHPTNDEFGALQVLPVSDTELLAYVEGKLDASRKAEIEGFLACNPDLAATVMQALHQRERLTTNGRARPATRAAHMVRIVAACVACGVAGWAVAEGLDDDGPFRDLSATPEYVDDAIMSLRVARVRIGMDSQVETPNLDSAEIQRATQIRLPALPVSWRLLDTQLYPSEEGPSVSMLIEAMPGQKLNLFAVRADTAVTADPVVTTEKGELAAYWELDGAAYVLTGDGSRDELLTHATQLSRNALM